MKLQSALDFHDLLTALNFLEKIHKYIDIVEVGTPLMLKEGCNAIYQIKRKYPEKIVLADAKIVDGGRGIATDAFEAGADIVTVLGMTNNSTIKAVVDTARKYNKKVCVDTIGVTNLAERVKELERMDVDIIAVHTAHDMLYCIGAPIDALREIKNSLQTDRCETAISGGIKPTDVCSIRSLSPDIIIVGSGLTKSRDPLSEVKQYKEAMSFSKEKKER